MNIKNTIKKGLARAGFHRVTALKNTCYIMGFHRVVHTPNPLYPDMSVQVFERQIRHLSKYYTIVPVLEIAERIARGQPLKGLVGLTFDDGFKDNYQNAYPILKKYNAPATIFLISECIESGRPPWFMKFRQAFLKTEKQHFDLTLGSRRFEFIIDTIEARKTASDELMGFLQESTNQARLDYLKAIYHILGPIEPDELSDIMLNWEEVREMSHHGISFGAHTHTHPVLSSLNLPKAEEEILKSKQIIQERTGGRVNEFAYPVGREIHFSRELFPVFKKHGFKYAVTTSKDGITHQSNPYALSRPYPWEIVELV